MADMCIYEAIMGQYPVCRGDCKRGPNKHCEWYLVDDVCAIMRAWKKEAHLEEPVITKYDRKRTKFVVYTTKPGLLIGRGGELFNKYSSMLTAKICSRRSEYADADGNIVEFVECDDIIG